MPKELARFDGIWGVLGSPLRQNPWVTSVPAHWMSNVPALLVCIQLAFSSRDPIVLLLTVSFLTAAISSLHDPGCPCVPNELEVQLPVLGNNAKTSRLQI